jgi:predicted GNAT family acetyltransferase
LTDDEWAFIHTEIEREYEGRGLATTLIRTALDEMRTRGISVLPYCPFVRGFIAKHSDYLDLVPEQLRPRFGL